MFLVRGKSLYSFSLTIPHMRPEERIIKEIIEFLEVKRKELVEIMSKLKPLPSGWWIELKMVKNYPQKKIYHYYYLRSKDGLNEYLGSEVPDNIRKAVEDRRRQKEIRNIIEIIDRTIVELKKYI